ncbi:MAG: phosphoribosylformylglycinamidine synthase subunit PurL [Candidatus Tyrphobacter sp.]
MIVALSDRERESIAESLGREPSSVELAAFDAQWSEHCSYKSSRRELRRLPTTGDAVLLGPGEDAGILRFGEHEGERYAIVVAHESHNHPSQIVPFEGAATGVGGIVRDVLCMGAEVVAIADALRFGEPSDPQGHQRHVARAVVDGIAAYGNAIGVPNIAGDAYFHDGFDENCLVNVVALGLVKEKEIVHSFAPPGSEGWPILLVGKATDASGFGGASFSSATLDASSSRENEGAVQVPDPFLKSVLMRATYRVFELFARRGIVSACKDLGAGGVMGCSAEMCAAGGCGARIDLDAINAARDDLLAEVLAVGETQERMLFVVPPDVVSDVLAIYNDEFTLPQIAYNARACVIGEVTSQRRYVLTHRGVRVMDVDIDLLTRPIEERRNGAGATAAPPAKRSASHEGAGDARDLNRCSREPLYRQYDCVVRACTVLPRGDAQAGVVAPIPGCALGVALAVAGDPFLGATDPRRAAASAVEDAVSKVVAVGARAVGLTDCLNFGNPQRPEHYAAFLDAIDGLASAAGELGLPFVSGNVSFYNESANGEAVPASAIVACVGIVDDVDLVVTPSLKRAGSTIAGIDDVAALARLMAHGRVRACRAVCAREDVDDAVFEMAMLARRQGRVLGVALSPGQSKRPRFVVELDEGDAGASCVLGRTTQEANVVTRDGTQRVADLYDAWLGLSEIYA